MFAWGFADKGPDESRDLVIKCLAAHGEQGRLIFQASDYHDFTSSRFLCPMGISVTMEGYLNFKNNPRIILCLHRSAELSDGISCYILPMTLRPCRCSTGVQNSEKERGDPHREPYPIPFAAKENQGERQACFLSTSRSKPVDLDRRKRPRPPIPIPEPDLPLT